MSIGISLKVTMDLVDWFKAGCLITKHIHTMWAPPVISWFINPSNYDYKYHKLQLYIVIGVTFTNLAIVWGPHFVHIPYTVYPMMSGETS